MKSMLEQFSLFLNLDMRDISYNEYEGEIFHYTSQSGFNSILFGNSDKLVLWASRYDCLNDASEGIVAQAVYKEVCEEMRECQKLTTEMYNVVSKIVPAHTTLFSYGGDWKVKLSRQECDRFICSFSKNRDSLAMWNYYSKGSWYEGFNIGIKSNSIKDSLGCVLGDKQIAVHICPVVYEREKQKGIIEKFLLKLQEHYHKNHESSICYWISNKLLEWGLTFKTAYFQHEDEVRIIVDVAKKRGTDGRITRPIEVKYRQAYGYTIPYIELVLEKNALEYVGTGPLQCDDRQKEVQKDIMRELLSEKGYSAEVFCSNIPVRY